MAGSIRTAADLAATGGLVLVLPTSVGSPMLERGEVALPLVTGHLRDIRNGCERREKARFGGWLTGGSSLL